MKIVAVTGLGGLWGLKWAWHIRVTNLRCIFLFSMKIVGATGLGFVGVRVGVAYSPAVCGR